MPQDTNHQTVLFSSTFLSAVQSFSNDVLNLHVFIRPVTKNQNQLDETDSATSNPGQSAFGSTSSDGEFNGGVRFVNGKLGSRRSSDRVSSICYCKVTY
jgi:superfamily II DNA/RNA helicase